MVTLRHKGMSPTYEIKVSDFKRNIYYEEYPDGSIVHWNKKLLKSGCGKVVEDPDEELMGCWYCPRCDEWFNPKHWEELGALKHLGN